MYTDPNLVETESISTGPTTQTATKYAAIGPLPSAARSLSRKSLRARQPHISSNIADPLHHSASAVPSASPVVQRAQPASLSTGRVAATQSRLALVSARIDEASFTAVVLGYNKATPSVAVLDPRSSSCAPGSHVHPSGLSIAAGGAGVVHVRPPKHSTSPYTPLL